MLIININNIIRINNEIKQYDIIYINIVLNSIFVYYLIVKKCHFNILY